MISIRVNKPFDFNLMERFYQDEKDLQLAWPGARYPFCADEWERWLSQGPEAHSLVFEHQGTGVGHLVLKPNSENQLYLCFIVLLREFRGQGLISEILSSTEAYVHRYFPHRHLYLHVDPLNPKALKAYERHGFKQVSVTDKGRYKMVKDLTIDSAVKR